MKFAFKRRTLVLQDVSFEAETEQEAWALALSGAAPDAAGDMHATTQPTFRRTPEFDEHDL